MNKRPFRGISLKIGDRLCHGLSPFIATQLKKGRKLPSKFNWGMWPRCRIWRQLISWGTVGRHYKHHIITLGSHRNHLFIIGLLDLFGLISSSSDSWTSLHHHTLGLTLDRLLSHRLCSLPICQERAQYVAPRWWNCQITWRKCTNWRHVQGWSYWTLRNVTISMKRMKNLLAWCPFKAKAIISLQYLKPDWTGYSHCHVGATSKS